MAIDAARAKSLFLAASDLPDPAARAAYLDRECAGDAELRARVEALLRANDAVEGAGAHDPQRLPTTVDAVDSAVALGTLVAGKYKLVEVIGEGGMGCVYMARQTEPVQRMVALKLIKPGMDSKAVLARFEAERQALAVMDHPHIAKILDGGLHDNRPFFVMELVKGTPITKFCDERKLTPRERLELFVPVCQAIQHAHQKGIIHRDIKPSNVLVALYDDRAVPKVIDFGVAKATGQQLTDASVCTGFGAIVGTPEYMSPEQASFNNLDIDTRSDVYALGVLLYELLAGSPPFSRKELEQAGLLEILRVVREVEPPRPSGKLSTADALPVLSVNRGMEPNRLTALLRGELDWIVMKALEKDRSRRYETANGFAADVQRYLAGEPVQAVPPSTRYRLKKFLRRNRGPVLAASLLLFALVGGIAGTTWGLMRALAAETEAHKDRDAAVAARNAETQALANEVKARQAEEAAAAAARAATARTNAAFDNVVDNLVSVGTAEFGPNATPLLTALDKHYVDLAASASPGRERVAAHFRSALIRSRLRDWPGVEAALDAAVRESEAVVALGGPDVLAHRHELGQVLDRCAALTPDPTLYVSVPGADAPNVPRSWRQARLRRAADHWQQLAADEPGTVDHHLTASRALATYASFAATSSLIEDGATEAKQALAAFRENLAAVQRAVALRPTDVALRWLLIRDYDSLPFYVGRYNAEILKRDPTQGAELERSLIDAMAERYLAYVRAAQQFPDRPVPETGTAASREEGSVRNTFESILAWALFSHSVQLVLPAWDRVLEQAPEFRYGQGLKLQLQVAGVLKEYTNSLRPGDAVNREKLAAARKAIEELRLQARRPGVVFLPGPQTWHKGAFHADPRDDLTPEQRVLFEWVSGLRYTTPALPLADAVETLDALVAADRPAGKPLSAATRKEVARLYLQMFSNTVIDHLKSAVRCLTVGEQLLAGCLDAGQGDTQITMDVYLAVHKASQLGADLSRNGKPDLAAEVFDSAIRLATPLLVREDSAAQLEGILEQVYLGRADLLAAKGLLAEAATEYARWLACADRNVPRQTKPIQFSAGTDPDTGRANRVPPLIRYGAVFLRAGQDEKAEAVFKEALARQEALARKYPNEASQYLAALHRTQFDIGMVSLGAEKWTRAGEWFERAVAGYEELLQKNPSDFVIQYALSQALFEAGLAYLKAEIEEPAAKWLERALARHDAMTEKRPAKEAGYSGQWGTLFGVGQAYLRAGKGEQAAEWFHRAHTRLEAVIQKNPADWNSPMTLCRGLFDAGKAFRLAKQWERAAEWYERAGKALAAHDAKLLTNQQWKSQQEKEVAWRLWRSHHARAFMLTELKRSAEASKEMDAARALTTDPARQLLLLSWATVVGRSGDHFGAAQTADEVLRAPKPTAGVLYDCACVYALASAAVKNDEKLRTGYADRAVETLKKAIAAGWKDVGHIRRDADLDSVRDRADFKQVVAELEKKSPP